MVDDGDGEDEVEEIQRGASLASCIKVTCYFQPNCELQRSPAKIEVWSRIYVRS